MDKFKIDLAPFLKDLIERSMSVKTMLQLLKPKAVISHLGLGTNAALGYWSKYYKIPAVLISHGSHVYQKNIYANNEHDDLAYNILLSEYEYLAVQSPLAREMVDIKNTGQKVINIHPIIWGRKIDKINLNKSYLRLTHAGTLKYRHQRRFIYESSDEYVSALIDICNIVNLLPNIRLVIKTRPQDYELSLQTLRSLLSPLPDNVEIETEKPFDEVLQYTDLLISFSSTTIEEALVNRIPVLLYGGNGRYSHIPVDPFKENTPIERPVTFIKNKYLLGSYFKNLNKRGLKFSVNASKFDPYRFNKKAL